MPSLARLLLRFNAVSEKARDIGAANTFFLLAGGQTLDKVLPKILAAIDDAPHASRKLRVVHLAPKRKTARVHEPDQVQDAINAFFDFNIRVRSRTRRLVLISDGNANSFDVAGLKTALARHHKVKLDVLFITGGGVHMPVRSIGLAGVEKPVSNMEHGVNSLKSAFRARVHKHICHPADIAQTVTKIVQSPFKPAKSV